MKWERLPETAAFFFNAENAEDAEDAENAEKIQYGKRSVISLHPK